MVSRVLSFCFFITSSIIFLSCGSDPILERAEKIERAPSKSSFSGVEKIEPKQPDKKEIKPEPPNNFHFPQKPKEEKKKEKKVFVKGSISVENWTGKIIRINAFDGDQKDLSADRPKVLAVGKAKSLGEYSIAIPFSEGKIWIDAYIDENQNGKPDPFEPSAWFPGNPLEGNIDHKNIDLSLTTMEDG